MEGTKHLTPRYSQMALGLADDILGPILAVLLFAIPSLLFAYNATFFGYRSGNKYLAKLYQEGLMDRVMHFASIVGLAA